MEVGMKGLRRASVALTITACAALCLPACGKGRSGSGSGGATELKDAKLPPGAKKALDIAKKGFHEGIRPALTDSGELGGMHATKDLIAMRLPAARQLNVRLGRTSAQLRSRGNAAPPWAADVVEEMGKERVHRIDTTRHFDLGFGRRGYLEAIGTDPVCVKCHGKDGEMDQAVREWVKLVYPGDKARGFKVGDLRGWFWMEYDGGGK